MIWIWFLQGALDVSFFVFLVILIWSHYRRAESTSEIGEDERVRTALNTIQERAQELDRQSTKYRQRLDEEIAAWHRISDRAKNMINQGNAVFSPSDEEYELKAAISADKPVGASKNEIPSLNQIERTRERLRNEISVDLRQLLRDQLA